VKRPNVSQEYRVAIKWIHEGRVRQAITLLKFWGYPEELIQHCLNRHHRLQSSLGIVLAEAINKGEKSETDG